MYRQTTGMFVVRGSWLSLVFTKDICQPCFLFLILYRVAIRQMENCEIHWQYQTVIYLLYFGLGRSKGEKVRSYLCLGTDGKSGVKFCPALHPLKSMACTGTKVAQNLRPTPRHPYDHQLDFCCRSLLLFSVILVVARYVWGVV